jgi:hypothetical protein
MPLIRPNEKPAAIEIIYSGIFHNVSRKEVGRLATAERAERIDLT